PAQPRCTLFPYTTLFRSPRARAPAACAPEPGNPRAAGEPDPPDVGERRPPPADGHGSRGGAGRADRDGGRPVARPAPPRLPWPRSAEHTSELQSRGHLVC